LNNEISKRWKQNKALNKPFKQDKKQLVFAPKSLILTNYYLPLNGTLCLLELKLKLRERLRIYTTHGGSWYHLKLELQKNGMSIKFSEFFVSKVSQRLGDEHSNKCLMVYDFWVTEKNEEATELMILVCSL